MVQNRPPEVSRKFGYLFSFAGVAAAHEDVETRFRKCSFRRNSLSKRGPRKKMAAGGMPAAQSQIAKTAPPYRLARSTTEYKYEEIAEIIGKVGKTYLVNVF